MSTLIKNGLAYQNDARRFLPLDILIENGRIAKISERGSIDVADAEIIDASNSAVFN